MIKETKSLSSRLRKMLLIPLLIIAATALLALVIFYLWASSGTLPENKLAEIITFPNIPNNPNNPAPPANRKTFTVMTCNIGYLSGMFNNLPLKPPQEEFVKNMDTFRALLAEVQPDILGTQEIDFPSRRSYYVDQLRFIAEQSGYPFAAKAVNWDKRYVPFPYWPPSVHFGPVLSGQTVFSRLPILSAARIVLEKPADKPFYYNAFYLDRLVQVVKIQIPVGVLAVLNVHLEAFDNDTRARQAEVVLHIYRQLKDDYPVLLIGDFNSTPPAAPQKRDFPDEPETDFTTDQTMRLFLSEPGLKAAETEALTFPADKPTRKLDYIFYNENKIRLLDTRVLGFAGSDHLPVVMRFAIR